MASNRWNVPSTLAEVEELLSLVPSRVLDEFAVAVAARVAEGMSDGVDRSSSEVSSRRATVDLTHGSADDRKSSGDRTSIDVADERAQSPRSPSGHEQTPVAGFSLSINRVKYEVRFDANGGMWFLDGASIEDHLVGFRERGAKVPARFNALISFAEAFRTQVVEGVIDPADAAVEWAAFRDGIPRPTGLIVAHPNERIRLRAIADERCSVGLLERSTYDKSWLVRLAAAENPALPRDLMEVLLAEGLRDLAARPATGGSMLKALLANPATPSDIVRSLSAAGLPFLVPRPRLTRTTQRTWFCVT